MNSKGAASSSCVTSAQGLGAISALESRANPALKPRATSALEAREVDALVSGLLSEIEIPLSSLGRRMLGQFADLKRVLSASYLGAPGLPAPALLKELFHVVNTNIRSSTIGKNWENPALFSHLSRAVGPRELEVRAEPYLRGAGLSLRGFFCRANQGRQSRFVIFLNTGHHPGAVAATFGHELGHYVYGSICGDRHPMTAFMEGTFGAHLQDPEEMFADSFVAFAAYSRDMIRDIGPFLRMAPGAAGDLRDRIRRACEMIGGRYKLDLHRGGLAAAWRVRYLTSLTHFFKLRCALLEHTGL